MDVVPLSWLESRRASLAASRRWEQDRMLRLAREHARLTEENEQLRRRCLDLAAAAEMWIRLYEAALVRANGRLGCDSSEGGESCRAKTTTISNGADSPK